MKKHRGSYNDVYGGRRPVARTGGNRTSTGLRVDEVGVVMAKGRQVDPNYTYQEPDDFTGMLKNKYPLGGRGER